LPKRVANKNSLYTESQSQPNDGKFSSQIFGYEQILFPLATFYGDWFWVVGNLKKLCR
jgi:hypothetical protein